MQHQSLLSRYEYFLRSQKTLQRYVARCIKRRGTYHPKTLHAIELEHDFQKEKRKLADRIYTLTQEAFDEKMLYYEEPMTIEYDV
jgi:hypothetical protein